MLTVQNHASPEWINHLSLRSEPPAVIRDRWRLLEWIGVACVIFLQSGAVIPLVIMGPDAILDDAARAKLRLVSPPVYLLSAVLLLRHWRQLPVALLRSLPLVVLLCLPFLSLLWSITTGVTLKRAVVSAAAVMIAYMIAIRFTPHQFLLLVAGVLGSCMVLSLLMMGISPALAFMPMEADLRGVFVHKNVLGWAAALCCMAATCMIIDRQAGMRRIGLGLLGVSLPCLLLSQSMTGLLALLAGLALTGFFRLLSRSRGLQRLFLLVVFLQVMVVALLWLQSSLVPTLEALGRDATLTGRVPLWELVDAEIARRLMLGFGYASFWSEGSDAAWAIWGTIGWQAPHAHNGYRDVILAFGLLGVLVLTMVLLQVLRQGAALQLRDPQGGWLWLNVLVGMFLVMNLSESLFIAPNDLPWILFATTTVMIALRHPDQARPRPA